MKANNLAVISFLNELELICLHISIAAIFTLIKGCNYYYKTQIIQFDIYHLWADPAVVKKYCYLTLIILFNKTAREEARRQLHKNAASNLEQVLAAKLHKTPTVRPPASYHENYSS